MSDVDYALLGVRDEDLTPAERARRARWLLADPAVRAEYDDAVRLAARVRKDLPIKSSLTAADVLAHARERPVEARASRR